MKLFAIDAKIVVTALKWRCSLGLSKNKHVEKDGEAEMCIAQNAIEST